MSREINNNEYRQGVIRELLERLHRGESVDAVKARFREAFDGVTATEISQAEKALIAAGLPVEEVQKLCDVHAAVFKDLLPEDAPKEDLTARPGHPAQVLRDENRALERLIEETVMPALSACAQKSEGLPALQRALEQLGALNIHYIKKENLFFPYMEQRGNTAPPKVMWGVDDEIRGMLKNALALVSARADIQQITAAVEETVGKIKEMIFKEENILLPMLIDTLSPSEWKNIADESAGLGYCLIPPPPAFSPPTEADGAEASGDLFKRDGIVLPTGILQLQELVGLLDTLPVDITFVDRDDTVKYFSQGAERVFPRTKAIIGRKVANCHPPTSVHIVEGILADFKSGKKTHEDFYIRMAGKYVYIRYFAVRDAEGAYLGTLEVTQDIDPIQKIQGEKRLVSEP